MKKRNLVEGKINKILLDLTIPMIFGMTGLIVFNLVDTYFVSKLGTNELGAISFTYPIVLIINSIALGIGMGTSSVISKVVGSGKLNEAKRLGTHSLILGVLVVGLFVPIGLTTIEPLFKLLGASKDVMPFIKDYMSIWYLGIVFVVIPMVGNNIMRALGDTKTSGIVMAIAGGVNAVLDPIFIFTLDMGIKGAAVATVISRSITFVTALYVLAYKYKIIGRVQCNIACLCDSFKRILFIGIPNAITRMIQPLGVSIIMSLLAKEGIAAVAAYGIATKVERFAIIGYMSLSVVMIPFTGQNFGAKRLDRVKEALKKVTHFSILTSIVLAVVLFLASGLIGQIFSDDLKVINAVKNYLFLVPISYGFYSVMLNDTAVLNALGYPYKSALINLIRMFAIVIPLALFLSKSYGSQGVFIAFTIGNIITALASNRLLNYSLIYLQKISQAHDDIK